MGWKLRVSGRGSLLLINSFPHEYRVVLMDFWCNMKLVGVHFYMKVMCITGEKIIENQVSGRGQCVLISTKPHGNGSE